MSALLAPIRSTPIRVPITPVPLKWTTDQFHQLGDYGVFEGRRAMLIDGVILEQGPMNPPHAVAGEKTEDTIRRTFGPGWRIRSQKPLILGQTTDPEPDLAVIRGTPTTIGGHPTMAELVIEISDSSLKFDTKEKMSLYAAGGVSDYWVVDCINQKLLVFRDPAVDASAEFGASYLSVTTYVMGESVSPLALPTALIAVSDLLP